MIKNKLGTKFHSEPVSDETYIKTKVREIDSKIKTYFLGNVSKENMHHSCIACITIDSVMRIDKKNHPQVYLEECKYRVKKIRSRARFRSRFKIWHWINGKTKIWFWFWISHFTLNNFYWYVFVDFECWLLKIFFKERAADSEKILTTASKIY